MRLYTIDTVTSVLQSIILSYVVFHCKGRLTEKINNIKPFFMVIAYLIIGQAFTRMFGEDWGMVIFAPHIISLIITIIAFKKSALNAVIAYSIVYVVLAIYSLVFPNLIFAGITSIVPMEYIYYEKIFTIYIPQLITLFLIYKYIDKLKQIHKFIMDESCYIILLIMSFFLDFILTFYMLTFRSNDEFFKSIIYAVFGIFFIVILVYFGRVKKKSEQIYKLNECLEIKNNELRKIKHDYGAQISYLYGLCLMSRFNDLKKSLKDIINNNESTPTAVTITQDEKSLLAVALKPALDKGIHVIVEDNCDFTLVKMNELELYKIVSNIVSNAIKALNGEGIIIAKSYEYLGNAVIKIENNGPKIPEHRLNKIFKVGFTTKENGNKNHGYGLSIANDMVKKSNGKIYVKSNEEVTEFKIVLPIRDTK